MSELFGEAPREPVLWVHRSPRVEDLADRLIRRIASDLPADPVTPVEIVVGSRGMERWLRDRIATSTGICANVVFPTPLAALRARFGPEAPDEAEDPWAPERVAWVILGVLPGLVDGPAFLAVRRWFGEELPVAGAPVTARAWSWARAVADAFDRYVLFRPDWLDAGRRDPQAFARHPWQAVLWDCVCKEIGEDTRPHLAKRLAGELRADAPRTALRIFGVSALPPALLRALRRWSERAPVEVYAFVPSIAWWGDDVTREQVRAAVRRTAPAGREAAWEELRVRLAAQNPLLTTLGRASRDFQAGIEESWEGYQEEEFLETPGAQVRENAESVLLRIQDDIRQAQPLRPIRRLDDSLRVHACHGALRQVEVLRDILLDLFARHGHLTPRDVLVLTPDLGRFAPLVEATFARGWELPRAESGPAVWGAPGGPRIPTTIADLGVRSTNAVADAVSRMFALARGRFEASAALDLLSLRCVQARFGLDHLGVERVRDWWMDAGFRWSMDGADRRAQDLPEDGDFTLEFALERIALGAVRADDGGVWEGIASLDDVEGQDLLVAGKGMQAFRTLRAWRTRLAAAELTPKEWAEVLRELVRDLTQVEGKAAWLRGAFLEVVQEFEDAAGGFGGRMRLDAVAAWLDGRLDQPARGDRPSTGAVTVSALSPMRSVPYKVIAVLGLDDDIFPRRGGISGLDLTAAVPRLGDRDPRDEDRHLFLEAILSARSHLVLCYGGRDPRTNEERPPATPLAELIDAVQAARPAEDKRAEPLVIVHPLQPFGVGAFAEGAFVRSFDAGMHHLATGIAARERAQLGWGLAADLTSLPPLDSREVTLDALIKFLRKPVEAYLRTRLGLSLGDWTTDVEDREPVELDRLESMDVEREVLAASVSLARERLEAPALADGDSSDDIVDDPALDRVYDRLRATGRLPPGGPGRAACESAAALTQALLRKAHPYLGRTRTPSTLGLRVGEWTLTGTVPDVAEVDETLQVLHLEVSKLDRPRHEIRPVVLALVLAAQTGRRVRIVSVGAKREKGIVSAVERDHWSPEPGHVSEPVGKAGGKGGAKSKAAAAPVPVQVVADDPEARAARQRLALERLEQLLALYKEGMEVPLRVAESASRAGYEKWCAGELAARKLPSDKAKLARDAADEEAVEAADKVWSYDEQDPYLQALFGVENIYTQPSGAETHPVFAADTRRLWSLICPLPPESSSPTATADAVKGDA